MTPRCQGGCGSLVRRPGEWCGSFSCWPGEEPVKHQPRCTTGEPCETCSDRTLSDQIMKYALKYRDGSETEQNEALESLDLLIHAIQHDTYLKGNQ